MIHKAFKKNLDLKFKDGPKGNLVHVIERPGLWMSDEKLKKLVHDLGELVAISIKDQSLDYGVLTGKKEVLDNVILTVIYSKKDNKVIAFNCLTYMPCTLALRHIEVVHLGLIIVHPEVRLGGISWILYGLTTTLIFLRNRFRPLWISNVTQVPAIIGKVTEGFGDIYPNPLTGAPLRFKHLVIAREILRHHRHVFGVGPEAHFNEKTFVIENSYTGGSDYLKKKFEEAQSHRNEIYNRFCLENLNYDRGDDFLQVGKINTKVIYDYLMKDIPSHSIFNIAGIFFYLALQGILLPLLVWFESNKYQGIIRPWKT